MSQACLRSCVRAAKRRRIFEAPSSYHVDSTTGVSCYDSCNTIQTTVPRPARVRYHSTSAAASAQSSSSASSSSPSSSVSQTEVSHFTNLASSWWDPHGPSRLLHLMNPLRHEFIKSCINTADPHKSSANKKYSYLDIGCGGGIFASSAARLRDTKNVLAIDPTAQVIEVAKQKQRSDPLLSQEGRLTYLNCAIEDLDTHLAPEHAADSQTPTDLSYSSTLSSSLKDENSGKQQFDIVTLFEVIEHLSHPTPFLHSCLSHLRPGGWLILSTIARHPVSYLTTKVIAEAPWPIGVVPRGTHTWSQYINPDELTQWFEKENNKYNRETIHDRPEHLNNHEVMKKFGDVQIKGCVYLPLLGWRWVSGSEGYGNYFLGVQKLSDRSEI